MSGTKVHEKCLLTLLDLALSSSISSLHEPPSLNAIKVKDIFGGEIA